MSDQASFSDDISGLWGPQDEGPLEPARPNAPPWEPEAGSVDTGNGAHPSVVDADPLPGVVALAEALASHRTDMVSKADLSALRSEIEGAFTHQLAVALYELLGVQDERMERLEQAVGRLATGSPDRLGEVTAQIATVRNDVSGVRQAIVELRVTLDGQRPNA